MEKLRSFLKQVTPTFELYDKRSIIEEVNVALTKFETDIAVLFCGEFKRGKSSIVNAIVGDGLCPTDIGIATSVITLIRYGEKKKAVRYYGNLLENPASQQREEIEWNDVKKYAVGEVLEIENTVLIELFYPSEFLKKGITIIDTPGIGGLDPRHAVLTNMALPKADVLVFVTDAGEPLTQSELSFYESRIACCGKPNVVLVNKSDTLTEDILAVHIKETNSKLAKFGSPSVIPVSAKYWELSAELDDKDLLLSSNKEQVLSDVSACIERFKQNHLKDLRDVIVATIKNISSTISIEIEQINNNSIGRQTTVESLKKQLEDLSKFRSDLENPISTIRLEINSIFEDVRNDVMNMISHEGQVLRTTDFDELLNDDNALKDYGKWLVAQVNDRLQSLSQSVDEKMEIAFEEISNRVKREIVSEMGNLGTYQIPEELKSCNIINSQFVFSFASKLATGAMVGSGVGLVLTELLIPGVGIIAGLATTFALIWKSISKENKEKRKNSVRTQLLPKIDLAITDLRNYANTNFSKFNQNLLQTIHRLVDESEDRMKSLHDSIMESRKSEKDKQNKITELEQKLKFCNTVIAQMTLLYTNPFKNAK